MVKRYELDAFDRLTVKEGGYLVYYEDYQALEAELEQVKAERDKYKSAAEELAEDIHCGDIGMAHKTLRHYGIQQTGGDEYE